MREREREKEREQFLDAGISSWILCWRVIFFCIISIWGSDYASEVSPAKMFYFCLKMQEGYIYKTYLKTFLPPIAR